MTIIDRRKNGKNKSIGNRQKFIKRYKNKIKRSVDDLASKKGITDVLKDRKITISNDEVEEPNFNFDLSTGERDVILPGNKNMKKGDQVRQPPESEEDSGAGDQGEGEDEFSFILSKEEFLDTYFEGMELPNFVKENLKGQNKYKYKRSGYSKEGIPPRLDLVKTLKQAMARRMATGSDRYLEEIDLRYKHYTKVPHPIKHATMVLLMDVSGSMGKYEKDLAKKFFLLLYLFLHKTYKTVDIIFISHTQEAKEVTEQEFFYGRQTGGTIVSSGLQKVKDIIDQRICLDETNVYIAQASDGDNWPGDNELCTSIIEDLVTKVQYFAYIQTEQPSRAHSKRGYKDLMHLYASLEERFKNLKARSVLRLSEVYPVLRDLFRRKL